jgi:magnesium chelatase subunit H
VRAYFLTLQYWLAGSEENIANLVRCLVDRYADGPRRACAARPKPSAPVEYPEVGVYHPRMPRAASSADADHAAAPPRPARAARWACC